MQQERLREEAEDIIERFDEHLDLEVDEIVDRLDDLVNEYQVPLDEATQSLSNSLQDKAGIDDSSMSDAGSQEGLVNEYQEDGKWLDIKVKVVDLMDPNHESISQTGIIGDSSGETRFTCFEDANLPELEEGKSYAIDTVVVDEYEGNYSIKLVGASEITELDDEVEVGGLTVEGAIVDFQSGSGLVKRCPKDDCTRVIDDGRCAEHGSVEGEFDMRIKAVLDTGEELYTALFGKEQTEELTGISISEAKQMAKDAMDLEVVGQEMKDDVVGQYYTVTGQPYRSDILLVNEYEFGTSIDPETVLTKARSI